MNLKNEPNEAVVPRRLLVTDCACAHSAPSNRLAHLERWAKMKFIPALILCASVACAATPSELEFTKALLPKSKHVSTEIVSGRLNGSAVSIYHGKESIESVAAALEKTFGKKAVAEEPDADWRDVARIFGEGGLGEASAYGQYVLEDLRFKVFIFQLRSEEFSRHSVLLIIGSK